MHTSTVVVGAGIVGLATASSLLNRDEDFLLLESEEQVGKVASGGEGRIFRLYHANPLATKLAAESLPLWCEWEEEFQVKLLNSVGHLQHNPRITQQLDILDAHQLDYFNLSREQVHEQFPAYRALPGNYLFTPNAGVINSRSVLAALAEKVEHQLLYNNRVLTIERMENQFLLTTNQQVITCDKLILTAGLSNYQWNRQLGIDLPELELSFLFRPIFSFSESVSLPTISQTDLQGTGLYSLPLSDTELALGLAAPHGASPQPLNEHSLQPLLQATTEQAKQFFPDLDTSEYRWQYCPSLRINNALRSDGFQVTAHNKAVAIAGGNLFKFAPLLGEILVQRSGAISWQAKY